MGKFRELLSVSEAEDSSSRNKFSWLFLLSLIILLVGLIILIAGIVLVTRHQSRCSQAGTIKSNEKGKSSKLTSLSQYCGYSDEAKRIDLDGYLKKVQKAYYNNYPNQVAYQPDLTIEEINKNIRERYLPYDPRPSVLKAKTDAAFALLKEINDMSYDRKKLKPREIRAIDQVKHFLKQNFGTPYDEHFYAGDWMLGPNNFCWQPICGISYDVNAIGHYFQPQNISDFNKLLKKIMSHKEVVDSYIKNLQLGVEAGFVREKIDCKAGLHAVIQSYKIIGAKRKADAVLNEWFTSAFLTASFLHGMDDVNNKTWMTQHKGKSLQHSLTDALVQGVGEPILKLITYLEVNHSRHCLPDGVSSGLGNLPVDYVYVDGVPDKTRKTTKVLPITGKRLSGKETYKLILPYFTTSDITPEEIYKKGQEQLSILYPKALELVKIVTNRSNEDDAIREFRKLLDSQSEWHGLMKFPQNESDANAHRACFDDESAKKYCPVRWKNIQIWADWIRQVMSLIYPKITDLFYFTGDKNTVPNCPIVMWPHYNPSNGAMFFAKSDSTCSRPTQFGLPFFLEKYGPKYHEWSVTGHEARPGHHTQFQGTEEHFRDVCKGIIAWVDEKGYYVNFIEGWGLYSENPVLSDDTDLYKENMLQKLGMVKWQIFRAVRLVVDTGLHYRGENRTWALKQFDKYTWDTTDFVVKEIVRYMSDPGQATAYMLGRLDIVAMREKAKRELGDKFGLKDFHYQILSKGYSPMSFIKSHIDQWISCVKDSTLAFCEYILTPMKSLSDDISKSSPVRGPDTPPRLHYV